MISSPCRIQFWLCLKWTSVESNSLLVPRQLVLWPSPLPPWIVAGSSTWPHTFQNQYLAAGLHEWFWWECSHIPEEKDKFQGPWCHRRKGMDSLQGSCKCNEHYFLSMQEEGTLVGALNIFYGQPITWVDFLTLLHSVSRIVLEVAVSYFLQWLIKPPWKLYDTALKLSCKLFHLFFLHSVSSA